MEQKDRDVRHIQVRAKQQERSCDKIGCAGRAVDEEDAMKILSGLKGK